MIFHRIDELPYNGTMGISQRTFFGFLCALSFTTPQFSSAKMIQLKKTKPVEFSDPDYIQGNLPKRGRKYFPPPNDAVSDRPMRIEVSHRTPPTPFIGNDRLANCIAKTKIGSERIRIFPNSRQTKCSLGRGGEILESQFENVCVDHQYAASDAFTTCYYGDDWAQSRKKKRQKEIANR